MRRIPRPASLRARGLDWLRSSQSGLVAMALAVGASAGVGAIVFRALIVLFTRAFTGVDDFSGTGAIVNPTMPHLGRWFLVLAPIVGGLLYGPLVYRFAREARGHGVPEVMLAVAERGGRIRPRVSVVKALASAICIGSGGSVGREGPIVQIGSALGSAVSQIAGTPENRTRVLVACGAAGGISATFNAPIAGVFFALELILADFAAESFGVVVLASVTAAVVGQAVFGSQPFLTLPTFHLVSVWEFGIYALLGLIAGVVGVGFIRVLYGLEDLADRLWRGPEWLRPAVGGVVLGLLLLALPELYGVGYPALERAVGGGFAVPLLLGLLVGKMLATGVSIAIGGSGGVFSPSLFMGAMLGATVGIAAHTLFGAGVAAAGAYGVVGMGAVFAGAARAPITAVLIIFELTRDYTIILPLMLAVVLATGVSHALSRDTVYTLKLRRRGIDLQAGRNASLMEVITVAEAMEPLPVPLAPEMQLTELTQRLLTEQRDALPVVDSTGAYRGLVTSRQVEDAMRSNALDVTAGGLLADVAPVSLTSSLQAALATLIQRSRGGVPVSEAGRLVGWLTHRDVLRAYHDRLERSVGAVRGQGPSARPAGIAPAHLGDFRILDVTLADNPPAGRQVREVSWPERTVVLALRRGTETIVPRGETLLSAGDRLSVLVPGDAASDFVDQITGDRRAHA